MSDRDLPVYPAATKTTRKTIEPTERDLLTIEQAAAFLHMSTSSISRRRESIRSYSRQNKLKAFRIAGQRKLLVARSELLKLLEPA